MSNLVVPLATVSTGVTLLAAFLLFGRRRRRDDEEGALVPAAAAAAAYTSVPLASDLMVDPGTGGTDVDLPRWRRPSLMAARKSDPIRTEAAAASLTFARGSIASAGTERRLVRYRIVRLLDRPDELMGATVGSLDEGDEVEVVEAHGLYRRVVTPDGRSGWLHKMTLGDLIEAPEFEAPIESDVLVAYLAARANS